MLLFMKLHVASQQTDGLQSIRRGELETERTASAKALRQERP